MWGDGKKIGKNLAEILAKVSAFLLPGFGWKDSTCRPARHRSAHVPSIAKTNNDFLRVDYLSTNEYSFLLLFSQNIYTGKLDS